MNRARRRRPLPSSRQPDVYQLHITLLEVEAPIWRRLQVSGALTLDRFHDVLQQVMGWTNSHLHEFVIAGRRYGEPDPDARVRRILPERRVALRDVVANEGATFRYIYDFGDNWRHEIIVEKILPAGTTPEGAVCLAGQRQCPPEDCGGVPGYEEFVEAIRDTHHPRHTELLQWVGGRFDPEAFHLDHVNRSLRRMRA